MIHFVESITFLCHFKCKARMRAIQLVSKKQNKTRTQSKAKQTNKQQKEN